eukprot:Tbor_TRINITY_DN5696_c3_g1::TRINITY_DN5696_c3_g1_i1::g.9179::m.9179
MTSSLMNRSSNLGNQGPLAKMHAMGSILQTDLYSQMNRLEPQNFVKFRCRLNSDDGQDVHRDFSGVYYPRWRAMYLDEVRLILGKDYKAVCMYPFNVYMKNDGYDYFFTDDFVEGAILDFGNTKSMREKGTKQFVVTDVDLKSLLTPTEATPNHYKGNDIPEGVVNDLLILRDAYIRQAGGTELGIKDMGRRFRTVDSNGNRIASVQEFKKCLKDVGLDNMPQERMEAVISALDKNNDRVISFDKILEVTRGPMSERRKKAVSLAFRKLDLDGNGVISLLEIKGKYNADRHPDVLRGDLTSEQVLVGFLATWDTRDMNGPVTYPEFCDYYNGVSASVDDDELFEIIVFSSWKLVL